MVEVERIPVSVLGIHMRAQKYTHCANELHELLLNTCTSIIFYRILDGDTNLRSERGQSGIRPRKSANKTDLSLTWDQNTHMQLVLKPRQPCSGHIHSRSFESNFL